MCKELLTSGEPLQTPFALSFSAMFHPYEYLALEMLRILSYAYPQVSILRFLHTQQGISAGSSAEMLMTF